MQYLQILKKIFNGTAVFLLCTVLALFAFNLLSSAAVHILKKYTKDPEGDAALSAELPLYNGKDYSEQYWADLKRLKSHHEVFTGPRPDPIKTQYVNVDESGHRRTKKTPNRDAKRVFMFGGSTMWGWGAPDDMTIPSCLQSLLGPEYDVYNLGQPSFFSTQELNLLLKELADNNIPDIVIFMDGQNDTYLGTCVGNPRWSGKPLPKYFVSDKKEPRMQRVLKELYKGSHVQRLVEQIHRFQAQKQLMEIPQKVVNNLPQNAMKTVEYYEKHIDAVKALGEWYGFKTYFFWQPALLPNLRNPLPYEQIILDTLPPFKIKAYETTYAVANQRFSNRELENIFYIADIFKNVEIPIYMDMGHTDINGNKIIAETIYQKLKESNAIN